MFTEEGLSTDKVANELNRLGMPYLDGRPWYQVGVYRVLTHPKYCGCHVFGRRSQILQGRNLTKPRSTWCMVPDAFEPIVSREMFDAAQRIIHSRMRFKTNEQLLDALRTLSSEKGKLSQTLVRKSKEVPSSQTFWRRLGGLRSAYQMVGYNGAQSSPAITETRRGLALVKQTLLQDIAKGFPGEVRLARENWRQRLRLRLRDNSLVSVYVCRSHRLNDGSLRWGLNTSRREFCKLSLVVRMNPDNSALFDFHLLPCIRVKTRLTLTVDDSRLSHGQRFFNVKQFLDATRTITSR